MLQITHTSTRYFDWWLFFITIALASIGLLFVHSATYAPQHAWSLFFKKQAAGICGGLCIYAVFATLHYQRLMRLGYLAYFGVIALLIFTLIKGHIGMGAQRWINLGLFRLQPAELAKLFFPAFAAYYLYTYRHAVHFCIYHFVPLFAMLGLSFILILKQPDLGTALLVIFCGLAIFWLAGVPRTFFLYGALGCIIAAPILWTCLKPYQKKRIAVFLGQGESHKERYQIEQSMIAIGSGGLRGKGLYQGTQNRLQFLPESRTDFIFAVLCEEWGLFGALLVLFLYALLIIRILRAVLSISSPLVQILALGITAHIMLSVVINIAMVIGLLPIVGIPLPLMSYGVCNLWVTFASLGWLQGIIMRHRIIDG